jgi:ethanolamine utilization protein EutQ (cupin superfamily)
VNKEFGVFRRKDAKLEFEGGARVGNTLHRIIDEKKSDQMGGGYFSIKGIENQVVMPYDELAVCLEGTLKLTVEGVLHKLGPGDFAWIPKGTEVTFAGDDAVSFYAVYPVDWRTRAT